MATHTVPLRDGWRIGEATWYDAEIREPTALDIVEAEFDSERIVSVDGAAEVVSSPVMAVHNLLARCITRIGDMREPAPTRDYFKGLGAADYRALTDMVSRLGYGAGGEARKRGRADPSPADAGGGDPDGVDDGGMDAGGSRGNAGPASKARSRTG